MLVDRITAGVEIFIKSQVFLSKDKALSWLIWVPASALRPDCGMAPDMGIPLHRKTRILRGEV